MEAGDLAALLVILGLIALVFHFGFLVVLVKTIQALIVLAVIAGVFFALTYKSNWVQ